MLDMCSPSPNGDVAILRRPGAVGAAARPALQHGPVTAEAPRWTGEAPPTWHRLFPENATALQQLDFHDAQRAKNAAGAATLEGTLERVVFSNPENGWTVVRLTVAGNSDPVTAVGSFHDLQPGENLRLQGSWVQDPKYGRQFRAVSYATVAPATAAGIERYLGSGLIRGLGKVMAKRLVARFGLETLEVIENQPE